MTPLFRRKRPPIERPPTPPLALAGGVGPGDYWKIGEDTVDLIADLAGLRRWDRVLDIGCGLGRVAWPLSHRLGRYGKYVGFDVALPYIEWCLYVLKLDPLRFKFEHIPVRSSSYNPGGAMAPQDFRFPWNERSFDLVVATSLFTHLLPEALETYLREVRRVLARRGRLFASFFLVDEESSKVIETRTTYPHFLARREWGWLQDAAVPEEGVAFDRHWLMERLAGAGLTVEDVSLGSWRGKPSRYYQDVIVARPRR